MKSAVADLIQIIRLTEHHDISKYDDAFLLQSLKRRLELTQQSDFSAYLDTFVKDETGQFCLTVDPKTI